MNRPVVYIFVNKDLGMSAGKTAAQVAHATVLSCADEDESKLQLWRSTPHRTIIVLQARDESHIRNIQDYLKERGFKSFIQIDEGINEVAAHSVTTLASAIIDKEDQRTIDAFSTFEKYEEIIKVNMEIKR
jgi:peptidyl-tRNA hydrolase, PTH2 family